MRGIEPAAGTFARVLAALIARGVIGTADSVLVQFAGGYDEAVCRAVGLKNVRLANIAPDSPSTRVDGDAQATTERLDAHRMPDADGSFDHVIAHSGLHHCSRPHEALHEMYRVARRTVVFVENQDSLLMRLAARVGTGRVYEFPAVIDGGYVSGGVDGSGVPNFVYRWTRRELLKTVAAFDPAYAVPVEVTTEWNLRVNRRTGVKAKMLLGGEKIAQRFLPSQGNIFTAVIRKDLAQLNPWMSSPTHMRRDGLDHDSAINGVGPPIKDRDLVD